MSSSSIADATIRHVRGGASARRRPRTRACRTFAVAHASVCTVSGSTATVLAAGRCTVAAEQAGDVNHERRPRSPRASRSLCGRRAGPRRRRRPRIGSWRRERRGSGAPPDTSLSGSSPLRRRPIAIALVGAMMAVALAVVFSLMTLTVHQAPARDGSGRPSRIGTVGGDEGTRPLTPAMRNAVLLPGPSTSPRRVAPRPRTGGPLRGCDRWRMVARGHARAAELHRCPSDS